MHGPRLATLAMYLVVSAAVSACHPQRFEKVPGETDVRVEEVAIVAPGGGAPALEHEALMGRLGLRAGNALIPDRYYNPYRLAEDRRRIAAFWETYGYFDVDVAPPAVALDPATHALRVTWTVREGQRYAIGEVHLAHAPAELVDAMRAKIPFGEGEREVDLEAMRKVRHALEDVMRRRGYGHAEVYSRTYVDRSAKTLAWYYLADAGPKTRIGKIVVKGNVKVPAEAILRRSGLVAGEAYDLDVKEKAELDLLDAGAFASANIRANTDTEFLVPGDAPDSGGILKPEQIGPDGDFVPRKLDPNVDLELVVVEAPSVKFRVGASFEIDPSRADTELASKLTLRNFFGPLHHLTLEGRLGYGVLFDARGEPGGLYGEALARYDHPGFIARLFDARITARYRDVLYPGFHLRELTVGPGVRTTIQKGLFFDLDTYFRLGQAVDFGPFDAATLAARAIPANDVSKTFDVQSSLVWDARNDPLEPTSGALAAARVDVAPAGTERWARFDPELRAFVPLSSSWSLGARASAGFILWHGDEGVPLGPRLFGGGAYGMRGFGLDELSPYAVCAPGKPPCVTLPVGGLSLFQATAEARWLPKRKPYGATAFLDLGGASDDLNPFALGPSLAAGVGLRLRLWYLPMAFDFAYRFVDQGSLPRSGEVPILVFFRIGEAF